MNDIDVLIIKVGHILKKDILKAPKYGIINKHASVLPANKGHFPYLYAYLKGEHQGYSLHRVSERVDSGELLCQKIFPSDYSKSMLDFYIKVFTDFPNKLNNAVESIIKREFIKPKPGMVSSYNNLPCKNDIKRFALKGGRVWRISDIIRSLSI